MKKTILVLTAMVLVACITFTGCDQADRVSENISTAADNFQVTRRFIAINLRTDTPLFEAVGVFSLTDETETKGRVVLTFKTGENEYKKHFVKTESAEIFWNVEDISGANVNSFKYEINILPEMFIPFDVVQKY